MVFGSFCSLKYYKRRKAILFVIITGDKNLKAKPFCLNFVFYVLMQGIASDRKLI